MFRNGLYTNLENLLFMLKVKIYNQEGQEIGEQELNPKIFGVEAKEGLIHQIVVAQMANQRQTLAHTKGRSDVRGGGKKPWRQKGTGRARHGSIRSPIWKGGGVTFGPTKERNFKKKINKRMKRQAILMCLSDRVKNNLFVILDKLQLSEIKTKKLSEILSKLPSKNKKTLVALAKSDQNILSSARNLSKVKVINAGNLNVLDVLGYKYLLTTVEGIKTIEEVFRKK